MNQAANKKNDTFQPNWNFTHLGFDTVPHSPPKKEGEERK